MAHWMAMEWLVDVGGRRGLRDRRAAVGAIAAIAVTALAAFPCLAGWPEGTSSNLPICTAPVSQDDPQIVPDGSGGVTIVWQSTSPSGTGGVFAQHVDREGRATWEGNGIPVCTVASRQRQPAVAADSSGGVIVAWQDDRSGRDLDVYAQRIDRSGALRWDPEGVAVSRAPGDQLLPAVGSDGHGGALIAWRDLRRDAEPDLYAQAIDSTGRPRWSADGIPIVAGAGAQLVPQVIATVKGGGIFIWCDRHEAHGTVSLRAQVTDADGNLAWGPDGVLVADGVTESTRPVAVADGGGSVILVWDSGPVYAQRLDESGRRLWGDRGEALSSTDAVAPAAVADGNGGAFVAWQTASYDDRSSDIRAQSVRVSGVLRWGADGIPVCQASGTQTEVVATRATAGGAIVIWRDERNDPFGDLYAQCVDSSGVALWKTDGIVISDAPGFQGAIAATADGRGGAVVVWSDGRAGRHIYAQRVGSRGRLGGSPGVKGSPPQGRSRADRGGRATTPPRE